MRQLMLFCVGGVIGFVIDAGIVQWLVSVHDGNPYTSRLLSFVAAATGTWLFNRHYTFHGVRLYGKFGEWARYMFAMSGGFAVNYSVYSVLVFHFPLLQRFPSLAVAAGSLAGLSVNYLSSKFWIYRREHP
ncbi:MAG TPA: GtrA family protein [Dokdonella sp.]|jgi:putative flippase GtrA|nr:GtrA family protein [Dokdonella sp.]